MNSFSIYLKKKYNFFPTPLIMGISLLVFVSCVDPLEKAYNEYKQNENNNNNNNSNLPSGSCKLTGFSIKSADNKDLTEDIVFTILDNNAVYGICRSNVDISYLKPSFTTSDGTVWINDVECQSGRYPFDFSKPIPLTVKTSKKSLRYTVTLVPYTGLPVVEILTDSCSSITSKETWLSAYMNTYGLGIVEDARDTVFVKKRGNGTTKFPKISFNVKMTSRKHVLDMKKQKRWCFLANYRDRTLIRNDVAFYLGQLADGLEWTPKSVFAQVIINGKHEGLYQVAEQIRVDKHRVDIDEMTDADISGEALTGGYLLEIDKYYDEINKFKTPILSLPVNIKSPDDNICKPEQVQYISDFLGKVETLLSEGKYKEVYDNYLDIYSFIDYIIVETLTNNTEVASGYSVYCYKKRNGKLYAGPLWDFEYTTFNRKTGVTNTGTLWYKYLFQDSTFKKALKKRWKVLKPVFESNVYNYIEKEKVLLSKSAQVEAGIYDKNQHVYKNGDEDLSFEDSIQKMKDIIKERIVLMDNLYMSY